MMKSKENWFKSWFDSPYYHLLYKHRNEEEALFFITHLIKLFPSSKQSLLDMACGRGRHSRMFHKMGLEVTGVDLSKNNIAFARKFEAKGLKFLQKDMLIPMESKFDLVTNLFTSMGYFPNASDNWKVIQSMKTNLNVGGYGVIDFLNVNYAEKLFPSKETKTIDGVQFSITKTADDSFFYKHIEVDDQGKKFEFIEKLKKINRSEFEDCIKKEGLELIHVFGNHDLSEFKKNTSKRLILIFKK